MPQHLHQISSNIIKYHQISSNQISSNMINSSLNPYINIHIFVGEILIAGAFGIQRIGQAQLMQPLGILGGVYRARVLESAGDLVTLKLLGGKDLELLIPSSKLT
jgi:hypothetical protein